MKLTGAEIIIKLLERQGISAVAGIPGGSNLPLYDALHGSRVRHILARHEQGAGFIAQGMARATGQAAVCFATSGPGATNLLTAIADAKLDSVPIIAITGQVPTPLIGTDAFQEVDTYGMTIPVTKHNFLVKSAQELPAAVPAAFRIALSGRPGPVLIDVPKDVQTAKVAIDAWPEPGRKDDPPRIPPAAIARAARLINGARRPVLYIGGGIVHADACEPLRALARKNSLPAVSTLMGLGAFPPDDPLFLGMLGMHGKRAANMLLNEADLLLAFGARFDDRATGDLRRFCPGAALVHVDIDPSEINKLRKAGVAVTGDLALALRALLPLVRRDRRRAWRARIERVKASCPPPENEAAGHPSGLIREIARRAGGDAIVTTDVGQHQMWVAQEYPFARPRRLLTSGGLGTMGFGLPAAIGAALAHPGKRVICVSGDGSLLMNLQELATLAELNLDVTVILLNNGQLGLVRQQQELFFNGNYIASQFETRPDFAAIGRAFGIRSGEARADDPGAALDDALSGRGPRLVNIAVSGAANVYPMVPPGAGNHEMLVG